MNPVLQALLSNAVIAVVLAAIVYALTSRLVRRPSIKHALWVLVLVKLVTPPLIQIPLTMTVDVPHDQGELNSATQLVSADGPRPSVSNSAGRGELANATPATLVSSSSRISSGVRSGAAEIPAWLGWLRALRDHTFTTVLLAAWAIGAGLWFAAVLIRLLLFRRKLKRLSYRIPEAEARCGTLATRIGCHVTPSLRFIDEAVTPMLWGCGRGAVLVFPSALWHSIEEKSRDALLLHELAHFRRGDYWVRLLETAVIGLFWWHPVVWLVRRELGAAEEECCDAWVIAQLDGSPRPYAEAIVATLDFIAEYRPLMGPVSSGIGDVPLLKQRLRQIMQRSVVPSMSHRSRALLILTALVVVPLHPILSISPASRLDASTHTVNAAPNVFNDNRQLPSPIQRKPVETQTSRSVGEAVDDKAPRGWWNQRPTEDWAAVTSADGRYRLTANIGNRVTLTNLRREQTIDLSAGRITVVSFTSDNRFVAGSVDGTVRLYDSETGEPVSLIGQHQDRVTAVATTADGRQIVSGSRDGAVILWDAASGSSVATWTEPTLPVTSVTVSPSGESILVAAADWRNDRTSRFNLFAMKSNTFQRRSSWATRKSAAATEFVSDRLILTATWNGTVEFRDLDGTLQRTTAVSKEAVSNAAFSSDYKLADRAVATRPDDAAIKATRDADGR